MHNHVAKPASSDFATLARHTVLAILIAAVAVTICFFFVDRPVAYFVADHELPKVPVFKWLTYPPPIVESWLPVVLAALMIRRRVRSLRSVGENAVRFLPKPDRGERIPHLARPRIRPLLARDLVSKQPVAVWHGDYGFAPFGRGDDVGSFPSGAYCAKRGTVERLVDRFPRARLLYVLIVVPMASSLVAMNYHFVGDIVGGAFLGGIVGTYAARLAGISPQRVVPPLSPPRA